jgi:hypothetical protein
VVGSWFFTKLFATIGCLGGGAVVFSIGYREFNPPPPPPGVGLCGNAVLGGLVLMVLGTPVGAIIGSLVAVPVGIILDIVLHSRKRGRSA